MPNIECLIQRGTLEDTLYVPSVVWYDMKIDWLTTQFAADMALRVCCSYRRVLKAAVGVITGMLPIDLMIQEPEEKYDSQRNFFWICGWYDGIKHGQEGWRIDSYQMDYFLTQAIFGYGEKRGTQQNVITAWNRLCRTHLARQHKMWRPQTALLPNDKG